MVCILRFTQLYIIPVDCHERFDGAYSFSLWMKCIQIKLRRKKKPFSKPEKTPSFLWWVQSLNFQRRNNIGNSPLLNPLPSIWTKSFLWNLNFIFSSFFWCLHLLSSSQKHNFLFHRLNFPFKNQKEKKKTLSDLAASKLISGLRRKSKEYCWKLYKFFFFFIRNANGFIYIAQSWWIYHFTSCWLQSKYEIFGFCFFVSFFLLQLRTHHIYSKC